MSVNYYDKTNDSLISLAGSSSAELEKKADRKNLSSSSDDETGTVATKAHSEGDYFNYKSNFVKAIDDIAIGDALTEGTNIETTNVGDELSSMKESFTDGCDTIVQAVTAMGQTPASNSPSDIATAIGNIQTGDETHGAITVSMLNSMPSSELLALNEGDNTIGTPININETGSRVIQDGDTEWTFTVTHNHQYSCNILKKDTTLKLVSWANGTDDQIAAMIDAYYNGTYTLNDIKSVWSIGDTRTITLSAMSATGVGESHRSQSVQIQILDFDHDILTTSQGGKTKALITVDLKNCLRDASVSDTDGQNNTENGYINSTYSNVGGWTSSARRTWCNDTFYNALPATIKNRVKYVNKLTSAGNKSSTINTDSDRCFLLSEIEIFGSTTYSKTGEGTQYAWYANSSSNRNKLPKWYSSYVSDIWRGRSPLESNTSYFCTVDQNGNANREAASDVYGLAPAFCL